MEIAQESLREYARLLIQVGLNVQKGQVLVIASPVECAYFARLCTEEAYKVGCREVVMNWSDDAMERMRFLYAEEETFDTLPEWQSKLLNGYARDGAAYLSIVAKDPQNLDGVDSKRITRWQKARGEALVDFNRLELHGGFPWCVAAVPIRSWARQVFPGEPDEKAVKNLWEAILKSVRICGDGQGVEHWKHHVEKLNRRIERLNKFHFQSLHYFNNRGTDLIVQLPKSHIWQSCSEKTACGQKFVSNIPTEEIFTAPLKQGVEGVVYSARPLVYSGTVIDRFSFVIHEGRIVEARAEQGEEALLAALGADEGASYFGEVALVPYDSPVSRQDTMFYNTLLDENAACHFAFGKAYPSVSGGQDMSQEQLIALGLNDSILHVDFMVGTPDLTIIGTTDNGKEIPVFENGNFSKLIDD